ncbi:MAG: 1-pyrroline-5-carboxylate dehydrogenase [Betaproteobacteria bacterium]|nr:MAG: 1-pyrroline-5-carboxylate dehydrogenase [Betaproteobacteria bacterium]
MADAFKLTYSTMFDPPPQLHARFDEALVTVRTYAGAEHAMLIGGRDERAARQFELRSPIDVRNVLGRFQAGDAEHASAAVAAARSAFPAWSATPWTQRVALLRRAAALIEERVFELGAVLALEVGKNRMEALGEAQETADLIAYYCDRMEANDGYVRPMARDPLPGFVSENASVLKPHGVWLVIAPFNFPLALAGGPAGAALVAGNTVVVKAATATPWSGRLLALALRDAGVPSGVVNFVTGPGTAVGQALIDHPDVAGATFTGSYDVGMHLYRTFAQRRWPRPCIAEMGGKNAAVVSRQAGVADAATGVARSAFGLSGQKCSACSRVYVERSVFTDFVAALHAATTKIAVGDPARREHWMGPVIDAAAVARFEDAAAQVRALGNDGAIVEGGERLDRGDLAHGHFVAPTIARAPLGHPLWQRELFAPFVLVAPVDTVDEGIALANAGDYGLTAGFYGAPDETERFFATIEAGVAYANRPQGATTGAWPGYQPFGGWKGSGSTGKAAGSLYYLTQYLREQSQTRVRRGD